jgi:hypothetical protein
MAQNYSMQRTINISGQMITNAFGKEIVARFLKKEIPQCYLVL